MSEQACEINQEMAEVLKSKRATSGLFSNLWFHDVANRMKIRRQAEAKSMGLGDDYPVGTYPSHGAVVINNNGGLWKGIALASLVAGGVGAGVMGGLSVPNEKKEQDSTTYDIEILGSEKGVKINSIKEVNGAP